MEILIKYYEQIHSVNSQLEKFNEMLKEEAATEDEIFWNMAGTDEVISL